MKKIAIARLRSRVNYKRPLEHIMDSFYWCLANFIRNNPQYSYTYYNFAFNKNPVRDVNAIKDADVILIPSENEFHAWVPNYLHRLNLEKCNRKLELIKPHLKNKKIIILSNDRADTIDLYKNYTFSDCDGIDYDILDEDDFPMGIHVLKYYFLTEEYKRLDSIFDYKIHDNIVKLNNYDFCYWGTDKRKLPGGENSGDPRHKILKKIKKSEKISNLFIGRFYNMERDSGMLKMNQLFPILCKAKSTLCFNWLSNTAITSRYHETMATKFMTPLVWRNYDETNRLSIENWQRCYSEEEVIDKIKWCSKNEKSHKKLFKRYLSNLPLKTDIYHQFEKMLLNKL